ncbi:uncharacterized protein TRIADDRAFT_60377 [Trichoplax adhaerens]|uniref:G-protein coupled receptors family 1 profile domain-containing protein n=1 Tax=Trichoplax adhaerens TaxID=10228 RepID=B3S821_TRIAD|nr:hypothetical protein TRIADDRAFT_60377 [Trichoplax adhaerens]EDV21030.1 hypothetical protein TRIADDRAFT_60377 [Trichoplax adhaerens]|eukprot:XP_002116360.1 hypothetical protein TRIADDRAFT_60377 [Trichoplax adhaerens]
MTNSSMLKSNFTPENALVFMILQTFFVCIGAPGNAAVAYYTIKKNMKLSDIMILILALSDGLYCIASYCFIFPDMLKVYLGQLAHPSNTPICRFGIAVPLYFGIVNIYCMTVLAITRYLAIVKPRYLKLIKEKRGVFVLVSLNWLLPLIFSLPQALDEWGSYTYFPDIGVCAALYYYSQGSLVASYYICLILFVVMIPTTFIGWSYHQIYLEVRQSRFRVMNSVKKNKKNIINKNANGVNTYSQRRQTQAAGMSQERRNREIALAKTLCIIVITYQISYIPYSVVSLYDYFAEPALAFVFQYNFLMVTYIGNIANPIIFLLRSKKFKHKVLKKKSTISKNASSTSETLQSGPPVTLQAITVENVHLADDDYDSSDNYSDVRSL